MKCGNAILSVEYQLLYISNEAVSNGINNENNNGM
jgi:hypothetical protein